jgi:hypothetical protein
MNYFYKLLILLLLSSQALAADRVQLSYDVMMSGNLIGNIDEHYTRSGDQYTISSVTTPLGLLAMFKPGKEYLDSRGLITKRGLKPLFFEDKRDGHQDKNAQAEFDWETQQLTLIHQGARNVLVLPEGTQDRLSAMYQFMFIDLHDTLDFFMTNGNKLDRYHYAVGTHEMLTTPAGSFDTIYLDNQAKPGENRTQIWLSVKYKLPCKMVITESNGNQFTQLLNTLNVLH